MIHILTLWPELEEYYHDRYWAFGTYDGEIV